MRYVLVERDGWSCTYVDPREAIDSTGTPINQAKVLLYRGHPSKDVLSPSMWNSISETSGTQGGEAMKLKYSVVFERMPSNYGAYVPMTALPRWLH